MKHTTNIKLIFLLKKKDIKLITIQKNKLKDTKTSKSIISTNEKC